MKKDILKYAAWSVLGVVVFVTISPISLRPHDYLPVNADRAFAFALLSSLFVAAYPRRWKWVAVATVLAAGGLELLQLFSPTRHAEMADALVKVAGSLAGLPVGLVAMGLFEKVRARHRRAMRRRALNDFNAKRSLQQLPVESRLVKSIYFDRQDGQLRIRLSNGHDRLFVGVTEDAALAISAAESPGNYYLTQFKTRYERAA
jgi:VanZ family protein